MSKRFLDRVVFITGGSAGIGAALGLAFAHEGARVALAARRIDKLEDVCRQVRDEGGETLPLAVDVTDRASLDAAVAETVARFGRLDIVVANAGFGVNGRFTSLNTDDFRRQFDTNVFGLIDTVYAALPYIIAARGHVVLISSIAGRIGLPTSGAYSASKFAVSGLAEALFYELAEQGVGVTCIEPGKVESEFRGVDNQGVYRGHADDPTHPFLLMPTTTAARKILNAIYHRKPVAVITLHAQAIEWAHRHFPRTFRLLVRIATHNKLDRIEARKRTFRA